MDTTTGAAKGNYRPRLSYYHPKPDCNGSAVRFELHPAHGQVDGSIFAEFARQKPAGTQDAGGVRVFPRFDWENRICVKLAMADLLQMLQVFRGMQETMGEGKGLFHRNGRGCTVIRLEHRLEPVPGYWFCASSRVEGGEPSRIGIMFTVAEVLGLSLAIEQSMDVIAFGLPMVVERQQERMAMAV